MRARRDLELPPSAGYTSQIVFAYPRFRREMWVHLLVTPE